MLRFDEINNLHSNDLVFTETHMVLNIWESKTDKYLSSNGSIPKCSHSMLRRLIELAGIYINRIQFYLNLSLRGAKSHSKR